MRKKIHGGFLIYSMFAFDEESESEYEHVSSDENNELLAIAVFCCSNLSKSRNELFHSSH